MADLTAHRPVLAVTLKIIAIGIFVSMGAIVKATSDVVPAGQAVFFRALFAVPVILVWLAVRKELAHGLRARHPWMHVRRGLLGTTAMGLNFAGLALLPLPEVTAIGFAAPIFVVILAALLLGERIRLFRISAVAVGLVGVLIILWPRLGQEAAPGDLAALGALFVLGSVLARSLVQVQVRQMVKTENTAAIVFWFSITATVMSLFTLPFGWVVPDAGTVALLMLVGVMGGIGQILITSAFRFAPASLLAPYDYTAMLFAIVIGYVWFDEWPTLVMLGGASLVIVANGVVLWRERQLGLKRGEARKSMTPHG